MPAFTSGEVAYLLQGNQETQVWGQPLGGGADTYPVLTTDSANRVYRVTFKTRSGEVETDHAVVYANPGGVGAGRMPEAPTDSTKGVAKWSMTDSADGEEFTAGTTVPRDMTVYAVWQEKYGGEAGEISVSAAYGTAVTRDLSAYMSYAAGMGTAGKFTYTVESGNDGGWFTVLDDTLPVSGDTPAGRYSLTIKATEKAPQFSRLRADSVSYDTVPVTLAVQVTVDKADPILTAPPQAKELAYTGTAQELVEAGTASGGTLQYSLAEDGPYSAAIPTGTEAGTYTVYYKIAGVANHNDTTVRSVSVTIAQAAPSELLYGSL